MNDIITLANVSEWAREKAEEIGKQEGNNTAELLVLADLQHFLAEEAYKCFSGSSRQ